MHIGRQVFGQQFGDWIAADPAHGKLKLLAEDFWSWQVESENIDLVRGKLRPTGMILCI